MEYTNSRNVSLTLSATDINLTEMRVAENPSFAGASWEAYSTSKSWILTSGDASKTVYAQFRDIVGNISSTAGASIVFDETKPVVDVIAFSVDPAKVGVITVSVAFVDSPAGMDTTISPAVDFVTANGLTGIITQLDYTGNNWTGHGFINPGDDGIAFVNVINGEDKAENIILDALNITNFLIDTTAPTNLFI